MRVFRTSCSTVPLNTHMNIGSLLVVEGRSSVLAAVVRATRTCDLKCDLKWTWDAVIARNFTAVNRGVNPRNVDREIPD